MDEHPVRYRCLGNGYLRRLAEHSSSDHHDVCRDVPEKGFNEDYDALGAKFGATYLPAFPQLVEHVQLTAAVVKVVLRYQGESAHIVVVGPDGFQPCACLQVLRCGLPCRHVLVALFTRLQRAVEFNGDCIHPRRQSSGDEWSIHKAPNRVRRAGMNEGRTMVASLTIWGG